MNKLNKNYVLAGIATVGYACHVTKSAKPLWALLLVPTAKFVTGSENTENESKTEETE